MRTFKVEVGASDPDFRSRYGIVWHSAWKFRHTPEAWIFLYEAMASVCMDTGLIRKFSRPLRTGVWRHGYWPLVFGLLGVGMVAIPFDTAGRLLVAVASVLGIGGATLHFRNHPKRSRKCSIPCPKIRDTGSPWRKARAAGADRRRPAGLADRMDSVDPKDEPVTRRYRQIRERERISEKALEARSSVSGGFRRSLVCRNDVAKDPPGILRRSEMCWARCAAAFLQATGCGVRLREHR